MRKTSIIALIMGVASLLSLGGCGSDNRESSQPSQVAASQACFGCHNGTTSSVTGNSVAQEYLASKHSTVGGGPGCDSCHHVDGHPQNGAIPPLPNNSVCLQCHPSPARLSAAHFANVSASYLGYPLASFNRSLSNPVPGASALTCNGCHNPHDVTSLLPVNQQWAQSGHAAINDDAFKEQQFIRSTTCNRCHTATGFRYYVTNGQRAVTTAQLGNYSTAKEVISCNACHTNYSWKRLSSDPSVTTFINFSTPYPKFPNVTKRIPGSTNPTPDIGDSKLCVPCHAGRTGSRVGAAITQTAATVPFDSHYLPAAAVMYGKIQFINFTSQAAVLPAVAAVAAAPGVQPLAALAASTYGKSLITSDDLSGGVTSTHRKLGTTAINGDAHSPSFFTPGHLDANGPCVVCHMTAGHTLQINQSTYNQVCVNCHTSERGVPLNAGNFQAAFLDENRQQMFDALSLAVVLLEQNYDISINLTDNEALESPVDVSFIQKSTGANLQTTATWAAYLAAHPTFTSAQVYKLKGALFNVILSYKEAGSYLHARTLTRRIIYDAIDFLDDGAMNMSVGTTAQAVSASGTAATNRVFGKFVKDTRAFVTDTSGPLFGTTTSDMTYIIAFDRTTGSWEPPQRERP